MLVSRISTVGSSSGLYKLITGGEGQRYEIPNGVSNMANDFGFDLATVTDPLIDSKGQFRETMNIELTIN